MEKLFEKNFNSWINKAISNQIMKGHTIEDIFPEKFKKYCKIFHPVFISRDKEDIHEVWNISGDKAVEIFKGNDTEFTKAVEGYEEKPMSFLTKLYGFQIYEDFGFNKFSKIWSGNQPKWLLGPTEGTLEKSIIKELVEILDKYTENKQCFFHYVPYAIDTYEDTTFKGDLSEFVETVNIGLVGSPNHVWPVSQDWFIYTNFDADFTLIGGKQELINEIINNPIIDALEWPKDKIFIPN